MSLNLTRLPFSWRMTCLWTSPPVCRSVFEVRLTCTSEPFVLPTAERKLFRASMLRTWAGLMFSAAIRSGFIQMRIANVRPPRMSAFCTPPTAVRALRLDVIDSVSCGDGTLEWRCDKSPNEFSIGADINCRYLDRGDVAARILAYVDRPHRLQTGDQDHKANHQRQHRALDE